MGNKWVKLILAVVVSLGIFGGVVAFVADSHPLGGGSRVIQEEQACIEANRYSGRADTYCYQASDRAQERIYANERWIAMACGAAAVALFWLLFNFFYLRPRRRRAEAAGVVE